MDQMEKEDESKSLSPSSSNGGQYDDNDYNDDNAEVLIKYKVSSAAEVIQSGQALVENMLIVDPPPPPQGSMPQLNLLPMPFSKYQ